MDIFGESLTTMKVKQLQSTRRQRRTLLSPLQRTSVNRRLFGEASPAERLENSRALCAEKSKILNDAKDRWNMDFVTLTPSEGRWQWEKPCVATLSAGPGSSGHSDDDENARNSPAEETNPTTEGCNPAERLSSIIPVNTPPSVQSTSCDVTPSPGATSPTALNSSSDPTLTSEEMVCTTTSLVPPTRGVLRQNTVTGM